MLSTQALNVWDDYVSYAGSSPSLLLSPELFACVVLLTNLGVVVTISLSVVVCKFILYFVNGPPWVLAPYQSLPEVLQLLIEKLWSSAYSFDPMGKCTYDTVLGREIMVTIPLQVLVSVSGLLVHCNT